MVFIDNLKSIDKNDSICNHDLSGSLLLCLYLSNPVSVYCEAVRECPFCQTLRYAQKNILEISTICLR